jgi:hypothetical protein
MSSAKTQSTRRRDRLDELLWSSPTMRVLRALQSGEEPSAEDVQAMVDVELHDRLLASAAEA